MLFHTDTLNMVDFANCAEKAGAKLTRFEMKGSKIRDKKFDVIFGTRISTTREKATWNQTGAILGFLFRLDPNMFVGTGSISQGELFYNGVDDFNDKTDNQFNTPTGWKECTDPFDGDNCILHEWENLSRKTGILNHLECKKCGVEFFPAGSQTPVPEQRSFGIGLYR